jgi:uncharacterized protein involved in exopolysaccharide biosynthesis
MESKESINLDLSNYLSAVKRRWITALSIFAGTVALGLIAASLLKPSYQADGKLLFKNPSFKFVGANLAPSSTEGCESGDLKSSENQHNLSSNTRFYQAISQTSIFPVLIEEKIDLAAVLKLCSLNSDFLAIL